jgi:hypothetical protein
MKDLWIVHADFIGLGDETHATTCQVTYQDGSTEVVKGDQLEELQRRIQQQIEASNVLE